MKLASVFVGGAWQLGVLVADDTAIAVLPQSLDDVVRGGPTALAAVRDAVAGAPTVPLATARVGPPLRRFNRDILCTGWNYWDHFLESKGRREGQDPVETPQHPTFFTKGPDTVIGPTDDIEFDPGLSAKWDYEAEVSVVIGRAGRSIPEEDAWLHIFGFRAANDISQRDLQRAHGGQWLKGKSIDATMPLGPWITTIDEIDDPYALQIQCEVNGELRQNASTKEMAFGFERLIAELSAGMTLRAGDILLTGTPSGIGNVRDPQVFLDEGDLVVTRISQLGTLSNRLARGRR